MVNAFPEGVDRLEDFVAISHPSWGLLEVSDFKIKFNLKKKTLINGDSLTIRWPHIKIIKYVNITHVERFYFWKPLQT